MQNIMGRDADILRKYVSWRIIDEEDRIIIEEMQSTGLINTEYNIKLDKRTAKTTLLGRSSID